MLADVSTLHGTLITIAVEPKMPIALLKSKCIRASPFQHSPLSINADLSCLMKDGNVEDLTNATRNGIRVSTWDGQLLPDADVLKDDLLSTEEHVHTLFKLVLIKRYNLNYRDTEMAQTFAARPQRKLDVTMEMYGTQFVVKPVWGDGERHNHILGLLYKHKATDRLCQHKGVGTGSQSS